VRKFNINPDIKKAETLPISFYKDQNIFDAIKEHGVHHFHSLLSQF